MRDPVERLRDILEAIAAIILRVDVRTAFEERRNHPRLAECYRAEHPRMGDIFPEIGEKSNL